ncbi:hypothetical protein P692DRAFT_20838810 [Suillus brevipes Sb2]|nr:hypothetical protein P692DRAFT_20838810 [Suillus brevipes Sb2]
MAVHSTACLCHSSSTPYNPIMVIFERRPPAPISRGSRVTGRYGLPAWRKLSASNSQR